MSEATDAEIELFHAFLQEEDPRVVNLMAHVLGFGVEDEEPLDLVAMESETSADSDVVELRDLGRSLRLA